MANELFLETGGACFLCFQEPLSDIENLMSEVSLQRICRYLNISPLLIVRTALKDNLLEEEKDPRFLKEKCEFTVTMCSTCSSLTTKLTDLINQIEMINNLLTYQLQIFHQTINRPVQDATNMRILKCGSSSEVEISLVETLRARIDKRCSQKVNDILKNNLPKVLLERLQPGNQEKNLSPLPKIVDSIKTEPAPLTRSDVSSLQSFPILYDPLSLPTPNHHLLNLEPESEILVDPLADQAIPQNSQSIRLETRSHKRIVLDTCKKYSKIVQSKLTCSLCTYSNENCDGKKMRSHLLSMHPEILFTSQRLLYRDTKISFNAHCKRLLSIESSTARRRGDSVPNGEPSFQCEFCERKFKKHSDFKYHLLMTHFKILEAKLAEGSRKMTANSRSNLPKIPQDSPSTRLEVKSHKRRVRDTCEKYWKLVQNKLHCSLCTYSNANCDTIKMRAHLLGVHPEILFTSQRPLFMGNDVLFNARCSRLLSDESFNAKKRDGGIYNGKPCHQCEFCETKFKRQFDFKNHLLMKHFKIMERKLSAGYCQGLGEAQEPIILQNLKSQNEQSVGDDAETFIVPDVVVNGRINCGKQITKKIAFQKRKSSVCSKEDGGCGKFFSNRWSLMNHKTKHCPSLRRRERWTCDILEGGCGQLFGTKSNLQRHQQLHCSGEKRSEAEGKDETTETDDNFSVAMECSVEDVVMSKVEVFDGLES